MTMWEKHHETAKSAPKPAPKHEPEEKPAADPAPAGDVAPEEPKAVATEPEVVRDPVSGKIVETKT